METSVKQEIEDHLIKQETSTAQKICRFCYNTYEEDIAKIEEKEREMMRVLCLTLDLSMSETPLICSTCQKKLEDCYNFKKMCIYTEECIAPYVVENVKVNLSEIYGQMIQCEDGMDINLCRLCMQPTNNDMTINGEDKEQFEQFFPEVNLNITSFVVLCTKCYNSLQKLLVFVSLCLEWEEKLHSYSEGEKVCLENFLHYLKYQTSSNDELMNMKEEGGMLVKNEQQEEAEQKFALTNNELEIKDEDEMDEMRFQTTGTNEIKEERTVIKSQKVKKRKIIKKDQNLACAHCNKRFIAKAGLLSHIKHVHSDFSKLQKYYCYYCDFETIHKSNHQIHLLQHCEPSEYKIYKCDACAFETKSKGNLVKHKTLVHDSSKFQESRCNYCNKIFRARRGLLYHMKHAHSDPSKLQKYYCDYCDFETIHQASQIHHLSKHSNSSEPGMYKCDSCKFQTKRQDYLRKHLTIMHNPSKFQKYLCDYCNFVSKYKRNLDMHLLTHSSVISHKIQGHNVDISSDTRYSCDSCDFQCKYKADLMKHTQLLHNKCDECDFVCTSERELKKHVLFSHVYDSLEVETFSCKECNAKYISKSSYVQHIRKRHQDDSKNNRYKCDKCTFETRNKRSLIRHQDSKECLL